MKPPLLRRLRVMQRPLSRAMIVAGVHCATWFAAIPTALWLAHGNLSQLSLRALGALWLIFLPIKIVMALGTGSFRELWHHVSIEDLRALLKNTLVSSSVLCLILLSGLVGVMPPWIAFVDGAVTLLLLGSLRMFLHIVFNTSPGTRPRRLVIWVGRRTFIDLELRRLRRRSTGDRVVGLVLEEPALEGALLRRVPVISKQEMQAVLAAGKVGSVVVVPPLGLAFQREIEKSCQELGLDCQPLASLQGLDALVQHAGAELLERPPVPFDVEAVALSIAGKRVLVTGGGGSIGSELARQLVRLHPAALMLVDRSENALFRIESELEPTHRLPIKCQILDVRDAPAVRQLFQSFRPEVVFHAAAHKHVPLMERHPSEAFLNNVLGTRALADAADSFGAQTFVFISTDKAVHPTSVMGATKRLGELYIKSMAQASYTRFVAVRFGNVLGSSGSVVPIFVEQIRRGGPVTVTHPEMSRYFMSIPEACQLVLKAAALAGGGEIFVLDMGKPVKIVDLARRLIERAGLRPDEDVPIVFSGTRPGEKLNEQLVCTEETATRTRVEGIWVVGCSEVSRVMLLRALDELAERAAAGDDPGVIGLMGQLIPDYRPAGTAAPAPLHRAAS